MREIYYHTKQLLSLIAFILLIVVLILKLKENHLEQRLEQLKIIEEVHVVVPELETNINTLK